MNHTFTTNIREYQYIRKKRFPYPTGQTSNVAFHRALSTDRCFFL